MTSRPFRFVHAGDLHLETVPQGVPDIPAHLRDLFRDASYRAAERVFDLVLAEKADFLVLSGDVIDPRATGLRGMLFLLEQFQRLANSGVSIYWAAGRIDAEDRWPAGLPLPPNVHRFPVGRATKVVHTKAGEPIAQLVGSSLGQRPLTATDLADHHPELFTIAVGQGQFTANELRTHLIDYWALGGQHEAATIWAAPLACYPGSPQGRSPAETGSHGALIIDVSGEEHAPAQARMVPTDVLRYVSRRISIHAGTTADELAGLLRSASLELRTENPQIELLVRWTIAADAPLGDSGLAVPLRKGALASELLSKLQGEFGNSRPAVWPLALEVDPSIRLATLRFEEPTMLGDLLRLVWQHFDAQSDETIQSVSLADEAPLDEGYVTDASEHDEPMEVLFDDDDLLSSGGELDFSWLIGMGTLVEQWPDLAGPHPHHKRQMLREVAGLSVDLLGG